MIGERVASPPTGRGAAVVFGLIGIAFLGIAVLAGSPHPAMFSILPFALGLAAIVTGDAPVDFVITEEGLAFEEPDLGLVRYGELCGVTAPVSRSRGDDFAIQVYYATGVVRIPRGLAISSRYLYDFLVDRLPPLDLPNPDAVPLNLRAFVTEQIGLFGPEKVFAYRARPFPPAPSHSRQVGYAVGFMCAAVGWFVIGIGMMASKFEGGEGWAGFGCLLSFLALLFAFLFARANRRGRPANWRDACVVISPGGIALIQGSLRGKMRWDELRAIEYPAKPRFGLSTHGGARSGLGLLTDGAYFIIADLYVRPLAEIRLALRHYWGGSDAN
jgi:hypothetical protein